LMNHTVQKELEKVESEFNSGMFIDDEEWEKEMGRG